MNSIFRDAAGVTPEDHHDWCLRNECTVDDTNVIHRSVLSSVRTTNWPSGRTLEVQTQQYYSRDQHGEMTSDSGDPSPTVYLHERGEDGYDLTPVEARQVAAQLVLHADLASGGTPDHPLDQAAHLILASLAFTGVDPGELHQAILNMIECAVDAMAEARRR